MMEIKVTLTIPGLPDALNNLAAAISSHPVSTVADAVKTATHAQQKDTSVVNPAPTVATSVTNGAAAATTPPVSPVSVPPVVAAQSSPTPTSSPANTTAAGYTIEQLSAAGAALCEQGKMPQLIALLDKYGVRAVTQLSPAPEILNAFAAEMKALGANL